MGEQVKNALAALSVAILGVSGLADDFEINLGPTNPQTIVLQDGTNDLHLVVGTEAILNLEWQYFITDINDFQQKQERLQELIEWVSSDIDFALAKTIEVNDYLTELGNVFYAFQDLVFTYLDWAAVDAYPDFWDDWTELDEAFNIHINEVWGALYEGQELSVSNWLSQAQSSVLEASEIIDDLDTAECTTQGWRYYDGTLTLSPATTLTAGGSADLSALQASLAELIVICSAIKDNTVIIADNSDFIVSQLRSYLHYLETIDSKLGLFYNLMLGWRDRLLQNGYFNVDWNKFKDNEAFRNTLLYNLNMSRPGYTGLPDLADYIVRFFRFPRDTYAVTNRYINGKPVPLVVSNVWSKAYAVVGITNILDSSGHPVPIWITNAVDRAAMDDMGNEADLQADLEGLDSLDVSVGTMDTSRIRSTLNRFSALSNDEPSTQILLFNGYQMGETIVDTTHWNINHKNLRVLRNIRLCLQTFWVLSSALICISIALLSAFLAVRVTVFGYALLWGGDAVNAGNRLFDAILRTFGLAPSSS